MIKDEKGFKFACQQYLSSLGIASLRSYGRYVGVARSTEKKKDELVRSIVAVLAGELAPIERSKRGAPVRDDRVDPRIDEEIQRLRLIHLGGAEEEREKPRALNFAEMREKMRKENMLVVSQPLAEERNKDGTRKVHVGQLETLNSVSMLLPLDCNVSGEKLIMPIEFIRQYDLREGDVVACYAEYSYNVRVVTQIHYINDIRAEELKRNRFEECDACYPIRRMMLFDGQNHASVTEKFMQWLAPIGKGQRGLVLSMPKSGKTQLLERIAAAATALNPELYTFALLVDQSPETVSLYRKAVKPEHLLYSTYEDEADRQVFVAEYILKRAKRFSECGKDVLLVVDSFNALARAFNDTEASLGGKMLACGLESKTVHYIKRYFGAARCLEKGGSITIVGSCSFDTGNPADEVIAAELSALSNGEIRLNDALAQKHVFPALDIRSVANKQGGMLQTEREKTADSILRSVSLPENGEGSLQDMLKKSSCYEDFYSQVLRLKNN